MPEYMKDVENAGMSLLSYDNHHNVVGHIKKLYSILHKKVDKSKITIVDKRSVSLVGINISEIETGNKEKGTFFIYLLHQLII